MSGTDIKRRHRGWHYGLQPYLFLGLLVLGSRPLSAQPAVAPSPGDSPRGGAELAQQEPSADFRIGPEDVLSIDVFGLDDLDRKVRVLSDGSISLPLLGTFSIAGLTLSETEQKIERMLRDKQLVKAPEVTIFVEEFVSSTVSVQGAVVKPGVYQLIGNKTLLDVLGEAGGIDANSGRMIFILRKASTGEKEWIEIDSERLTDQGDLTLDIPLRAGDVVMVPHAKSFRVYVTGAVERPGPVDFSSSEGITVLQAMTAAGGPTARANLGKVHVIRRLAEGGQERIDVNIKRIRKGRDEDLPLQRNDTVVVGEWFF